MEDVQYYVDKTVHKFFGSSESTIVNIIMNCIDDRLDKQHMIKKLSIQLDEPKAAKLTNKIFNVLSDTKLLDPAFKPAKKMKVDEILNEESQPVEQILNETQIKEMMANAQKIIEARKQQLNLLQNTTSSNVTDAEKLQKTAELHARIQSTLARANLSNNLPVREQVGKPTPLILDDLGRTIDMSGKTIHIPQPMPTLKANIRARKREEFKIAIQEKPTDEINSLGKFYDSRLEQVLPTSKRDNSKNSRSMKALKFNEKGKYVQMAHKLRAKARLEKLQSEITEAVKKTGIISAAKLALIIPKRDPGTSRDVPQCEWWDSVLLKQNNYDQVTTFQTFNFSCLEMNRITNLIQHPMQLKRQRKKVNTDVVIVLTKKERKKLRRQNRREIWLEKQEKIRLGLEAPPEPKLKISNLMRVLGKEAILDPTKIEAHVRAQMAKRAATHEEANAARKLTPDEKRTKIERKIKEDTTDEVHVTVFRIKSLHNPAKKFKVEANANQLFMTGFVALYKDINVLVIEGGPKQTRKFKHLMTDRIKWEEDRMPAQSSNPNKPYFVAPGSEKNKLPGSDINKCEIVWEGIVPRRNFGQLTFKLFPSEAFAREAFTKHGVEQYWNLAYSRALLENADDNT